MLDVKVISERSHVIFVALELFGEPYSVPEKLLRSINKNIILPENANNIYKILQCNQRTCPVISKLEPHRNVSENTVM